MHDLASMSGLKPKPRVVWEVTLIDGTVAVIVPDLERAKMVLAEGRQVAVYTLDEIAKLLEVSRDVVEAKLTYPGAIVTHTRRSVQDPLQGLEPFGFETPMDDDIPEMT